MRVTPDSPSHTHPRIMLGLHVHFRRPSDRDAFAMECSCICSRVDWLVFMLLMGRVPPFLTPTKRSVHMANKTPEAQEMLRAGFPSHQTKYSTRYKLERHDSTLASHPTSTAKREHQRASERDLDIEKVAHQSANPHRLLTCGPRSASRAPPAPTPSNVTAVRSVCAIAPDCTLHNHPP